MLFPLGTDRPLSRRPRVTTGLVVANLVVFVAMAAIEAANPDRAGEILGRFAVVRGSGFEWFQLLSSAFLHGGLVHIGGNMLFLWAFGPAVEDRLRWWGFAIFYACAAAASGLVHIWLEPNPAIGASGAIAGVTGAFLVLFPRTTIRCFYVLGGIVGVPAWWLIGLGIAFNLLFLGANDGIARWAHLGGYGFGFGVAMALLGLGLLPREPYDLFTMFKQAKRRRQFRAAGVIQETSAQRVARQATAKAAAESDALAAARAEVSRSVSSGKMDEAADAYRALLEAYPGKAAATTLSRNAHYRLANHLVTAGRHAEAAAAWSGYLEMFPADPEADAVRVLLARLSAEHLGDTGAAKELLMGVLDRTDDQEIRDLATEELNGLGGAA